MSSFYHFIRIISIFRKYPKSIILYIFKFLSIAPGISCLLEYNHEIKCMKDIRRKNRENVGHAMGNRIRILSFLNYKIFKLKMFEGVEATLDQFYLNRSVSDLKRLIKISSNTCKINSRSLIFDPGCGAGRHLHYLVDKYRCKGIGVDIYKPAIEIANLINKNKNIKFYNSSSLDIDFIESILPNNCDIMFINSWLNHAKTQKNYKKFVSVMKKKCRYMMVVNSQKDDINKLLDNPLVLLSEKYHKANLFLIKCELKI